MKSYIKSNWLILIGGIAGAIGGFVYWYNLGCLTGTCPIKSSPYLMIVYGILIGSLIFNVIQKIINKKKSN